MKRLVLLFIFLVGCAHEPNDGRFNFYSSVVSNRGGMAIVIVKIENGTSKDARIVSHCRFFEDNLETESRWIDTFVPKHSAKEFTVSYTRMDKGSVNINCKHYKRNR